MKKILLALLLSSPLGAQQLSYTKGQNISPAYEGWEIGSDGARYFLFGYMNRNWVEEIDVPIGAENGFNVGGPDQGQPTHFLPRRNRFVFRVKVPAGFTEKDELVWTLTSHGKTERAYATLRPDYVVDDVVKASETGALGAGTSSPEVRGNHPPTVHIQELKARTVKAGEPFTVVSEVKDDGIPKRRTPSFAALAAVSQRLAADPVLAAQLRNPSMSPPARITVGKNLGLHVSWFVYRGPVGGTATFDPPQVKPWEDTRAGANSPWAPQWAPTKIPDDGKQPVQVTFSEPGTYVLRCRADDGALVSDEEVTIVVVRPVAGGVPALSAPTTTTSTSPSTVGSIDRSKLSGPAGKWDATLSAPQGQFPVTLSLSESAGKLTGTFNSQFGEAPLTGTLDGKTLKFSVAVVTPQGALNLTLTGDVEPDAIVNGQAEIPGLGQMQWAAKRSKQ